MGNKERFLSGRRKLTPLTGLSTDRHVYLSPEETEPNLGFVGEKTLPLRDEYYQLVTVENGGQYDRYWQVAPSGILTTGISIFDEGGLVGTGNSINKLNFVGNIIQASANDFGSISTITISPPGNASNVIFNDDGTFAGTPYLLVNSSGIATATDVFHIGVGGTILASKTNGYIGIGSVIPRYELDIAGNVKISGAIIDSSDGTGSTGELLIKTATGGMEWQTANAVTSGAGGTIGQMQYHTPAATVGGADNFWFDYINNRVGIGTQFPEVLFEVQGDSKFVDGTLEAKDLTVTGVSSFIGVSTFTTGVVIGSGVSTSDLTVEGGSFVSGISTSTVFDGRVSKRAITDQVLTTSADGQTDLLLVYDADQDNVRKISIEDATFQGLQGIQGRQGIQGTQGTQAAQGTTGQQGIRGAQGIQGLQGIGAAGVQGVQGRQGIQGIQGIQGTQGRQGNQGRQGVQGRQGTFGNQGIQGISGAQGNQASQGIQGIQGIQGRQGTQGIQGRQGYQGIQGVQGIQGTGAVGGVVTGSIVWYAGDKGGGSYPNPPSGFLYCDGSSYGNISNFPSGGQYQDLFNAIGYQYGGSGQNFNVPDLRGEFIRGYDDSRGVDSGRGFATYQQHQFQTHTHDIPIHAVGNQDWSGGINDRPAADDASFIRNVEGGAPNASNGGFNGAETRPRNINFLPIIKT